MCNPSTEPNINDDKKKFLSATDLVNKFYNAQSFPHLVPSLTIHFVHNTPTMKFEDYTDLCNIIYCHL